jgi:hypothetical protein
MKEAGARAKPHNAAAAASAAVAKRVQRSPAGVMEVVRAKTAK